MSAAPSPALLQAIALHRAPTANRPRASERLPAGVTQLVRIAAGEEASIGQAQALTGEPGEIIVEASRFYIQQVLFAPHSDSYRTLGVNRGESDDLIREHFRWLVRWLHPDRNPDQWEAFYADRVNRAWQDLRNPERRARYEQELREEADDGGDWTPAATPSTIIRAPEPQPAPEPPPDLRWVPKAMLVSLGLVALALIGIFSALQFSARPARQESVATAAPVEDAELAARLAAPAADAARIEPRPVAAPAPVEGGLVAPPAPSPAPAVVEASSPIGMAPAHPQAIAAPSIAASRVASAPIPTPTPIPIPIPRPAPAPAAARIASQPVAAPTPSPAKPETLQIVRQPPPPEVLAASAPKPRAAAPRAPAASRPAAASVSHDSAALVPAAAEMHVPPPAGPDSGVANRIMGDFSQAYGDGDIDGMRQLFADEVRSDRGGLSEILAEYRTLFGSSERRSLHVHDVSWFAEGETLTVIASYSATVSSGDKRARKSHGDLRFDLRKINDRWRIFRFQHGERSG